jgi:flagellar protein FlaG
MNISFIGSLPSPLSTATEPASARPSADQKSLIQAVKTVNASQILGQENELTFVIDRAARIAVVRIINKKTGDVVQQIPNQQVLKLAEESNGG